MNIEDLLSYVKMKSREDCRSKGGMSTFEILSRLYKLDKDLQVIIAYRYIEYDEYDEATTHERLVSSDFHADSWRGSYDMPAIAPDNGIMEKMTVQDVIDELEEVDGRKVVGYKGGDFVLNGDDVLFVAHRGSSGDSQAFVNIVEEGGMVVMVTEVDMY